MISDGQVAGEFGDVDPAEAALAIASLLDGLTVQVRLGDEPLAGGDGRGRGPGRRAIARLRAAAAAAGQHRGDGGGGRGMSEERLEGASAWDAHDLAAGGC